MWKKTDNQYTEPEPASPPSSPAQQFKERAIIGPSIIIKGDLSGEEDLTVQGRIEGTIDLRKNNVTVGASGKVKADIHGKVISIEGEVQGNLFGEDKIIVRKSGKVKGNIAAPRVTLEEGAKFKGSIDMDGGGSSTGAETHKETPRQGALKQELSGSGSPGARADAPTPKV